jgi:hypothetical protein
MFWSLLYDHPQGSSFVLSAFTTFRLLASSFAFSVCGCMPCAMRCLHKKKNFTVFIYQDMKKLKTYDGRIRLTYVYVCSVYLSVGCLVMNCLLLPVVAAP